MQNLNPKPSILKVNQIHFNIYHYLYLYTKHAIRANYINRDNPNHIPLKTTFGFVLPHTILYLDDIPKIWLFTSKTGEIKKKYSSKLVNNKIIEFFKAREQKYGKDSIVASYMYCSEDNKEIKFDDPLENEVYLNEKKLKDYMHKKCLDLDTSSDFKDNYTLIHQFFNSESLTSFLANSNKRQGVLQLFISSQQDPNSTYRLIWSPDYLTAQIKHSRQIKSKQGIHFYEKTVTFENDEYCVNMESVKSEVAINKLNSICCEIISSIETLFKGSINIKNAVFHMKQDLDFEVNLLFCSSIGFIEYEDKEHQVFVYKGRIFNNRLSDDFRFNPHKVVYFKKNEDNYQKQKCVNCDKVYFKECFHAIDYKAIIKYHQYNRSKPSFQQYENKVTELLKHLKMITVMAPTNEKVTTKENRLQSELMRCCNSEIPYSLKQDVESGGEKQFKKNRSNKLFLEKKVLVCEKCFFEFIDIKNLTDDDFQAKIFQGNIKKNIIEKRRIQKVEDKKKTEQMLNQRKVNEKIQKILKEKDNDNKEHEIISGDSYNLKNYEKSIAGINRVGSAVENEKDRLLTIASELSDRLNQLTKTKSKSKLFSDSKNANKLAKLNKLSNYPNSNNCNGLLKTNPNDKVKLITNIISPTHITNDLINLQQNQIKTHFQPIRATSKYTSNTKQTQITSTSNTKDNSKSRSNLISAKTQITKPSFLQANQINQIHRMTSLFETEHDLGLKTYERLSTAKSKFNLPVNGTRPFSVIK